MKNIKAIIILSVLILLFLIGNVSANDINTTDAEVISTIPKHIDSINESTGNMPLDDSEVLCVSTDVNSSVQNDFEDSSKEDLLLSNSNVNILDETQGGTTISATITSPNTLSVTFQNVYLVHFDSRILFIKYNNQVLRINGTKTLIDSEGVLSGSGSVTFSSNIFEYGKTYSIPIYAINENGNYLSINLQGITYWSGMTLSVTAKATPTISFADSSITYAGTNQKVFGTVKSGSTNVNSGSITIKYNGNTIGSGTVNNGVIDATITSSTFAPPSTTPYDITVEYGGNSNYDATSGTGKITVNKIEPTISVGSQSVYYGQTNMPLLTGTIYSTSGNYYGGTVDLYIDNQLIASNISVSNSGSWSYTLNYLPILDPGSYDVKIVYSGSTYASAKTETKSNIYTVLQNEPTVTTGTYNVYYGQSDTITVSGSVVASNVANVYTGKINITIGTETYDDITVNDDGSWSLTVLSTQFNPNTYDIKMEYSGNKYCKNKTAISSGAYVVNQNNPEIRVNSQTISYGQSEDIIITGNIKNSRSTNVYNGTVNITIGDTTWNKIVVNNDGSWSLPSFNSTKYIPNTYNISVAYSGNNYTKFKTNDNAGTLTVSKGTLFPLVTNTGNIDLGKTEYVYVSVLNYAGNVLENISVILKGNGIEDNITNTTNSDGKSIFSISDLTRGKYADWKLTIKGNEYYNDLPMQYPVSTFYVQSPLTVTITSTAPNNTTFPEEIIVTGYTDADQNPQGNVSLIINGKTYTGFFDSNGNFTASLIGVKPGTYTNITAKYNPTADEFYYRGVESTVSIQETAGVINNVESIH